MRPHLPPCPTAGEGSHVDWFSQHSNNSTTVPTFYYTVMAGIMSFLKKMSHDLENLSCPINVPWKLYHDIKILIFQAHEWPFLVVIIWGTPIGELGVA